MTRDRTAVAAWATLVALAVAGCGGSGHGGGASSSPADYYNKMTKLGESFSGKLQTLSNEISPTSSNAQQLAAIGQLQVLFKQTQQSVAALAPPAKVRASQARLISELSQAETVTADLGAAFRSHNANQMVAEADRFDTVANKIPSTFLDITVNSP